MSQRQQSRSFTKEITVTVTLPYLLYLPKDYASGKRWPLILFLHGSGERGSDLKKVADIGLAKRIEKGQEFPFIIVSPQCPSDSRWSLPYNILALAALLDEIEQSHAVDPDRIYLTGLSMGGYGTWALAATYPQRFAAAAPICGGGDPASVRTIPHLPIWAFHGDADDIVPLQRGQMMVDALRACGGNVKFTVYPGVKHDSWTRTYANPELYTWFLQHRRAASE